MSHKSKKSHPARSQRKVHSPGGSAPRYPQLLPVALLATGLTPGCFPTSTDLREGLSTQSEQSELNGAMSPSVEEQPYPEVAGGMPSTWEGVGGAISNPNNNTGGLTETVGQYPDVLGGMPSTWEGVGGADPDPNNNTGGSAETVEQYPEVDGGIGMAWEAGGAAGVTGLGGAGSDEDLNDVTTEETTRADDPTDDNQE